jgi:hypothetical protein
MSRGMRKERKPRICIFSVLVEALAAKWPKLLTLINDTTQVSTQSSAFKKGLKDIRGLPGDPLYKAYCELKPVPEQTKAAPREGRAGPSTRAKRRRTAAAHARRVDHVENYGSHSEIPSPTPSVSPEPRAQMPQLVEIVQPAVPADLVHLAEPGPAASLILNTSTAELSDMLSGVSGRWEQVVQLTRQVTADNIVLRDKHAKLQQSYDSLQALHQRVLELAESLQRDKVAQAEQADQADRSLRAAEQRAALLARRVAQLEASLKKCAIPNGERLEPPSSDPWGLRAFVEHGRFCYLDSEERALVTQIFDLYVKFTRQSSQFDKLTTPSQEAFANAMKDMFRLEVNFCDRAVRDGLAWQGGWYFMGLSTVSDLDQPGTSSRPIALELPWENLSLAY